MMALSGVRNSWLIWARNSDLERTASAAPRSALASRTSSLASTGRADFRLRIALRGLAAGARRRPPAAPPARRPPPPAPGSRTDRAAGSRTRHPARRRSSISVAAVSGQPGTARVSPLRPCPALPAGERRAGPGQQRGARQQRSRASGWRDRTAPPTILPSRKSDAAPGKHDAPSGARPRAAAPECCRAVAQRQRRAVRHRTPRCCGCRVRRGRCRPGLAAKSAPAAAHSGRAWRPSHCADVARAFSKRAAWARAWARSSRICSRAAAARQPQISTRRPARACGDIAGALRPGQCAGGGKGCGHKRGNPPGP